MLQGVMMRAPLFCFIICWSFVCHLPVGFGQKTPFNFCSRIVAVQQKPELSVNTAFGALRADDSDPIGCVKRKKSLGPKNGLQVSACEHLALLLEGQNSVFALKLEIEDKSGVLRAFQTDVEGDDGTRETAVCFQHNVPMGNSEFADDSPRCLTKATNAVIMFVTETCPEALDVCVDNWLIGTAGNCGPADASQPTVSVPAVPPPVPQSQQRPSTVPVPPQGPAVPVPRPPVTGPTFVPPPPAAGSPAAQRAPTSPSPVAQPLPPPPDGLVIPSDLPEDIPLPGGGVQGGVPPPTTPVPSSQRTAGILTIDLCMRMYSTTDKVDRSTCTGFGPSLQDPIRCIEEPDVLKPAKGIAYTACSDLSARMFPGSSKDLFNLTIGGRPGKISATLGANVQEDRPFCLFIDVDGEGVFPKPDEPGCMHPWEPVSVFVAKTCRKKKLCSYHSLMVTGGRCRAPRVLPEEDLKGLVERKNDMAVGFGEPGSQKRYGSPQGPKKEWIQCDKPDSDVPSPEEAEGEAVEEPDSAAGPVIKSRSARSPSPGSKPAKPPATTVGG